MANKSNGRTSFEIELQKDVEYIKKTIKELKDAQAHNFVTKAEFEPIKNIMYGMIGTILTGVIAAVLAVILI